MRYPRKITKSTKEAVVFFTPGGGLKAHEKFP